MHLGSNPIEDIGPLSNLTQLRFLRLNDNRLLENIDSLASLAQLRVVHLDRNAIVDISPLAGLTGLTSLDIRYNQIENLSPLANLTQLTQLLLNNNKILDVNPLAHLTQLTQLHLGGNQIEDISPLANLTQLTQLWLDHNKIKDVRPLANLTRLEILDIRWNSITEHSPLDGLSLDEFRYDETCDIPPSLPLQPRLEKQQYPFLFQAWGGEISNRPDLSYIERLALHDLWMSGPQFGLSFQKLADRHVIRGRINDAIRRRDELLALNPNMIFLVDIRLIEHWEDEKPEDWPHWVRDTKRKPRKPISGRLYGRLFTPRGAGSNRPTSGRCFKLRFIRWNLL